MWKLQTPTAENFFSCVSADTVDALILDFTGTDPQGYVFEEFRAQKAPEALALEKLFSDARPCALAGSRQWRVP